MMKAMMIDSGEYANGYLSYPKILSPLLLQGGFKIEAYAYAQSEDRYPDIAGIDIERREKEKQCFFLTADFLNLSRYTSWETEIERQNFDVIIITMEDGVNSERREEIIETILEARGEQPPPILTMPPQSLKSAESLAKISQNLVLWYPLRFASGVSSAKMDIELQDFEISSCNMSFGTAPYSGFFSEALPQYIDLILHLIGAFEDMNVYLSGTQKAPAIAISARHRNGAAATYLFEANRFFQRYPHARFEITSRAQELLIIDDSGLRRKSVFSNSRSDMPGFSHDHSNMDPGQTLLHLWMLAVQGAPNSWLPTIHDACETLKIIEHLKTEIEKLT